MDLLDSLIDTEFRLELVLVEALHHEAEWLIGATGEVDADPAVVRR